jgi:hypothetical protein
MSEAPSNLVETIRLGLVASIRRDQLAFDEPKNSEFPAFTLSSPHEAHLLVLRLPEENEYFPWFAHVSGLDIGCDFAV